VRGAALAALVLLTAAPPALAASFDERAAACLACHGPNGQSLIPETPSIGGQPFFFVVAQLFLFRRGGRSNPVMTEVAKPLTDADLRAIGEWVSKLPPPPPPT
jgi:cytochrome c553